MEQKLGIKDTILKAMQGFGGLSKSELRERLSAYRIELKQITTAMSALTCEDLVERNNSSSARIAKYKLTRKGEERARGIPDLPDITGASEEPVTATPPDPLEAAINTENPQSPEAIKPMGDDEFNRRLKELMDRRPWMKLSLKEAKNVINDVNNGFISEGQAYHIFESLIMCTIYSFRPTKDEINDKDVLRGVLRFIDEGFAVNNEEYAYNTIVQTWNKGNKNKVKLIDRVQYNKTFQKLEEKCEHT